MKVWRHLSANKQQYVYHPTKKDADRELERLSIVNCANASSRSFFVDQRHLEVVNVWVPDSKASIARMMNKIEAGEEIQWLM